MGNEDFIKLRDSYKELRLGLKYQIEIIEEKIYAMRENGFLDEDIKYLEIGIRKLEDKILKEIPRLSGAEPFVVCKSCGIHSLGHKEIPTKSGMQHYYFCLMPDCNYAFS